MRKSLSAVLKGLLLAFSVSKWRPKLRKMRRRKSNKVRTENVVPFLISSKGNLYHHRSDNLFSFSNSPNAEKKKKKKKKQLTRYNFSNCVSCFCYISQCLHVLKYKFFSYRSCLETKAGDLLEEVQEL